MDSKTIVIIIIVVVVIGIAPFLPKIMAFLNPPPPPDDNEKVRQIQEAVDKYEEERGYLPTVLEDLIPSQMASVPKTDSGQSFLYNPRDGYVSVPAARAKRKGGPSSGPMGEVMTGIGISEELNF